MKPTILLTLLLTLTASAFEFTGKVVGVADGDTITVLYNKQQHKVRFQHIDCPESTQAFGAKAKEASQHNLDNLLYGAIGNLTDPTLAGAIRSSLGWPEGELTEADLEKVTALGLDHNKLTDVPKGLEKLTQLTVLHLCDNQLTDVKGLEKLPANR